MHSNNMWPEDMQQLDLISTMSIDGLATCIFTALNNDGIIGLVISTELHTSSCTSVNLNVVSAPINAMTLL